MLKDMSNFNSIILIDPTFKLASDAEKKEMLKKEKTILSVLQEYEGYDPYLNYDRMTFDLLFFLPLIFPNFVKMMYILLKELNKNVNIVELKNYLPSTFLKFTLDDYSMVFYRFTFSEYFNLINSKGQKEQAKILTSMGEHCFYTKTFDNYLLDTQKINFRQFIEKEFEKKIEDLKVAVKKDLDDMLRDGLDRLKDSDIDISQEVLDDLSSVISGQDNDDDDFNDLDGPNIIQ